jgi:triacylglycerol esterase/lipase EstA (alpha/beta hydrolase family)
MTAVALSGAGAALSAAQAASASWPRSTPSPPGTNNFSCRPSAAHPQPLVLLEGLGGNSSGWGYMAPGLLQAGYCVFTLTYGVDPRIAWLPFAPEGSLPMEQSSHELAAVIDHVLAATGAGQVDLVGHSEGTVMPRYYLKFLGGAAKVKRFVALTPLWRGSTVYGIAMLRDKLGAASAPIVSLVASVCTACTEVLTGSPFLNAVNAGGEAVPGVAYTSIVTRYDELVVPYTSGIMHGAGTNIVLQDVCPTDISEHIRVAADPVVAQLIHNALDPPNAKPVRCSS